MTVIKRKDVKVKEIMPGIKQYVCLDRDKGTGAVTMGEMVIEPGVEIPLHTHKVEDAMIVLSGSGIFIVDGQEYPFEPQDGLLAPAGSVHGIINNGKEPLRIIFVWPAVEVERFFV